jgi:hypothetical protein
MSLYQEWINAKEVERVAIEKRREIEDQLIETLNLEVKEGSETVKDQGFRVKITQRFNRSIDADALQEIAAANGLTEHLSSLFRWKPEINQRVWKDTNEAITTPLLDAITTKAGRPSFAIETIETK